MTRIETGVAAGYWDRWNTVHALKELIANAKDATITYRGATYTVSWEPSGKTGLMTIEDTGGGFDKRCLMLGAGEQIRAGHIKRFHEGMKGAMLVAARQGLMFDLRTTGFAVPKVAIEDTQLGEDGFVIYADFEDRLANGTIVTMECTEAQARSVATHFAGLKIEGLAIETCDDDRLVWPAGDRRGKVFVNGALATDRGEYLFNYNFDLEKLDQIGLSHLANRLKEGQNRDREHVDVETIEYAVCEVLSHCEDPEVIRYFLTAWDNGRSTRREYMFSRGFSRNTIHPVTRVKGVWKEVFRSLYPTKTCLPPRSRGGWRSGSGIDESAAAMTLSDHGWTVLPNNMPDAVCDSVSGFCQSVTQVIDSQNKDPQEKRMDAVHRRDWTPEEEAVIERVVQATCRTFGLKREDFPTVQMFVRHYHYPDAPALWSGGKVLLKRSHVQNAIGDRGGFLRLCGSVGHEYGHKVGGADHSAEFERSLTHLLGVAIARNAGAESEEGAVEVDDVQVGGWCEPSGPAYSYDQIVERFDGISKHKGAASDAMLRVAKAHEWSYAGVVVEKNLRSRPYQSFVFTARDGNSRRTPLTMVVTYNARRNIRTSCYRAGTATTVYANLAGPGGERIERTVEFSEYDLAA